MNLDLIKAEVEKIIIKKYKGNLSDFTQSNVFADVSFAFNRMKAKKQIRDYNIKQVVKNDLTVVIKGIAFLNNMGQKIDFNFSVSL